MIVAEQLEPWWPWMGNPAHNCFATGVLFRSSRESASYSPFPVPWGKSTSHNWGTDINTNVALSPHLASSILQRPCVPGPLCPQEAPSTSTPNNSHWLSSDLEVNIWPHDQPLKDRPKKEAHECPRSGFPSVEAENSNFWAPGPWARRWPG